MRIEKRENGLYQAKIAKEQIELLSNDLDVVSGNLATVSGDIVISAASLSVVNNNLNTVSGNLTTVSGNLNTVSGNLTTVSGNLNTVSGNLNTVSGNLSTVSGNLTTVSGNLNTVSGNLTALDGKLNTVSGNLTTVSQDLAGVSNYMYYNINPFVKYIEVCVVGGGGPGGHTGIGVNRDKRSCGAGGGGGEVIITRLPVVLNRVFNIEVGNGGAPGSHGTSSRIIVNDWPLVTTITAAGGGPAASRTDGSSSGFSSNRNSVNGGGSYGIATTGGYTNRGGLGIGINGNFSSYSTTSRIYAGGGGAGAGGDGQSVTPTQLLDPTANGYGSTFIISGTAQANGGIGKLFEPEGQYYGGGGASGIPFSRGGIGGGGEARNYVPSNSISGESGMQSTGGGGSGTFSLDDEFEPSAPNGGSGVVVIAYQGNAGMIQITGSPTINTVNGYTIVKFTGTGTLRWMD